MKNDKLHPTHNPLPAAQRAKLVELLNSRLASAIDLQLQAKTAHWNVKGPSFQALHLLFDQVYTVTTETVDQIAERAVQLGGEARGQLAGIAKNSKLKAYPAGLTDGTDHVDALGHALGAFALQAREAIEISEEIGDPACADLFTAITQDIEKQLWMVEAHRQADS